MNEIKNNIQQIQAELPHGVRLVAVSKFHPKECIEEAYAAGQRIFGESHAQEIVGKQAALPNDIEWHFIGHLQTNKVKQIAPFIALIHSVDSEKLLKEIDKQAANAHRIIPCLLQLHVAQEESKFGFSFDECAALLNQLANQHPYPHVSINGLMCMASNTDNLQQVREEFARVYRFFNEMKAEYATQLPQFSELSMGMSHDYPIAVAEGSTLVRVGSKIFGERIYE